MCARIAQLILLVLFVYLTATAAAFAYLPWWQAILAEAALFLVTVAAAKLLLRRAVGRVPGAIARGLFDVKSRVLRGATADVHHARPVGAAALVDPAADLSPENIPADAVWYEVEATIFPDPAQAGPMTHWDLSDLRLVSAGRVRDEFELHDVREIENGEVIDASGGKPAGPQRLRFRVAVPPAVRELQFRYYFEQFGRVRLPGPGG